MKRNFVKLALVLAFVAGLCSIVTAAEIITADDIKQKVVPKEILVRTADNIIVLVDTSSSMAPVSKHMFWWTKPARWRR
ncbi:MAG: hypothetical protein P8X90_20890 [Desulfobacterales bacterium]